MNFNKSVFIRTAADPSGFPNDDHKKRIVFVGRSNVGKSSTINTLVNHKNFARVSATPGKTVYVNLFQIDNALWLIDLPGYGYSKTSKQEKERYSTLIDEYFEADRNRISRIFVIVDSRHAPSVDDKMMVDWIRTYGVPMTVIANKTDKLKKNELAQNLEIIKQTLLLDSTVKLIPFSAEKGTNRDLLIKDILDSMEE